MTAPIRIQRRRTAGWRMPPGTIYVGRPTIWGNPWDIKKAREVGFRGADEELNLACVSLFKNAIYRRLPAVEPILSRIHELRGHNLACWCPLTYPDGRPYPCHADVLLEIANG